MREKEGKNTKRERERGRERRGERRVGVNKEMRATERKKYRG